MGLVSKRLLGPQTLLYPLPALLVGANVDGKPNFMAAAWSGIANSEPPMLSVALNHRRHTLKGVKQNYTFSVNVPSVDLAPEMDYCGMASGSRVDKVEVCRFKVFYGKLGSAPLIEQCPVNIECRVAHLLDLGSHCLVIGRIEEVHISEDCLTNDRPDVNKIKPIIYLREPAKQYLDFGRIIGKSGALGKALETRE